MQSLALWAGLALGIVADAPECRDPPSRASDSYWLYIEACGCAKLDPPSKASLDYERFMKACSLWRERNPEVDVIAPPGQPAPETEPAARPSSSSKPRPTPTPSPKTTP